MARARLDTPRRLIHRLRPWWPLALLVAFSVGLRLHDLGRQSLWADEAVSWSVSRLTAGEMMALSEWDHHPPLYYLLLKAALGILPATEAGLRAVSVAASALALVAVLAFLAREWSSSAAIYAGLLMALSSFDLYYAQEARMYTVLAAAWILSYIGLVKALQGRPRWLIVWAIATAALAWTHMYGLVVVGANVAFVAGYLVLKRLLRLTMPLADRSLFLALLAVLVAILPMVRILLLHADTSTSAAWVPQAIDLRDLYLLWTVGMTATRHRFLFGEHLTLPLTEGVTPGAWLALGTLIAGAPAVFGLVQGWRLKGTPRLQALLTLTLVVLPVAVAFGYAAIRDSAIWIQRPFLGAAYLVYLWAGIGFAAIPWRRARWALPVLAVVVALASLAPYFTIWSKSSARQAFNAMPTVDEHNALLLEPRYVASLARFFFGVDTPMLAIEPDPDGIPQLIQPLFQTDHPYIEVFGRPFPVACDELAEVTDLWLYGDNQVLRRMLPQVPSCVLERHLWVFEQGQWAPMTPPARDTIHGHGWLQFDDIRNANWTDQSYRHLNPGDAFIVTLLHANAGDHRLFLRHYDAPHKVLEIWAGDQRIGQVGDGRAGGGWVMETLELPASDEDPLLILVRSVGTQAAGVASLGTQAAGVASLGVVQ
jgi:uncharacterized membrane protein